PQPFQSFVACRPGSIAVPDVLSAASSRCCSRRATHDRLPDDSLAFPPSRRATYLPPTVRSPAPRETPMNVTTRATLPAWPALAMLLLTAAAPAVGQQSYFPPKGEWERRTPEEMGLDPALVQEAVAFAQANESAAPRDLALNHTMTFGREPFGDAIGPLKERGPQTGIIVHRGYIVAEWGEPERVDPTFSVAKSVLSSVVGLAYDRGMIADVHDRVAPYMAPIVILGDGLGSARPDAEGLETNTVFEPFTGPHNSQITWDHLLRQTSDWEGTLWGKPDWADRPARDPSEWVGQARPKPGTRFEYNDVRVNLLALAILNVWRRPLP